MIFFSYNWIPSYIPLILCFQTYNSKTNIVILLGIFCNYGSNLTRIHWCNSMDNVRQVPNTQLQIEDCISITHQLTLVWFQLMYYWKWSEFWKNWGLCICVLKMNGIHIHFLFLLNLHSLNIRCNTALSIIHFICI